MTQMKIDITSDVLCPFCLIGVKQLLTAIDRYKTLHPTAYTEYSLRLLPYELNAALPKTPQPRKRYYEEKFGAARADQIISSMGERFQAIGLQADFSGDVSSSHTAHRLQTYALLEHPELQLPLAMDIFTGFHCERKHPSDLDWLASLAVRHGIFPSTEEAIEWLKTDECDAEVRTALRTAYSQGVTGVPFFVFQDRYAASGAMGVDEFVHLLEEIDRRETVLTRTANSPDLAASATTHQPEHAQGGEICA